MSKGKPWQSGVAVVTVPASLDTHLSLVPSLTTTWPEGFTTLHASRATVTLTLASEDPTDPVAGSTVELFVDDGGSDEGTEQLPVRSLGPFRPEDAQIEPGYGRDDLGCALRQATPLGTAVVTAGTPVTLTVPGLAQGMHAFRWRVTGPDGAITERALLYQVLPPSGYFGPLPAVGSGLTTTTVRPRLFGTGPPSLHSPDCQDSDVPYTLVVRFDHPNGGRYEYFATTDATGIWALDLPEDIPVFTAGDGTRTLHVHVQHGSGSATPHVVTGRRIPLGDGGEANLRQVTQGSGNPSSNNPYQSFTLTVVSAPPSAPRLDPATVPAAVLLDSRDVLATARLRFRVLDDDQDLDERSVTVTNQTAGGQGVPAWMSDTQGSQLGWWEADVVLAAGPNQLCFAARDRSNRTMTQTVTVSRTVPNVVARIASPASSGWPSRALVDLDGSTSAGTTRHAGEMGLLGRGTRAPRYPPSSRAASSPRSRSRPCTWASRPVSSWRHRGTCRPTCTPRRCRVASPLGRPSATAWRSA